MTDHYDNPAPDSLGVSSLCLITPCIRCHHLSQRLHCMLCAPHSAPCIALSSGSWSEFLANQTKRLWLLDKHLDSASTLHLYCTKDSTSYSVLRPSCIVHCVIKVPCLKKITAPKFSWIVSDFILHNTAECFRKAIVSSLTSCKRKKLQVYAMDLKQELSSFYLLY